MKNIKSVLMSILICFTLCFSVIAFSSCSKKQALEEGMIVLEQTSYVYDGTAKEPAVSLYKKDTLIAPEFYTVSYENNINVGTANVIITATDNSKEIKGSVVVHFEIISAEMMLHLSFADVVYDGQNHYPTFLLEDYVENVCPYRYNCGGSLDYDFLNETIWEGFGNKFYTENNYQYFVIDDCYCKIDDKGNEIHRFSEIIGSLKDVLSWISSGVGICDLSIYYSGYNRLLIELCHHDGSDVFQLVRLNKQGQDYYDKGYEFDYDKYCIKQVAKDFKYLDFYINR